MFMNSEINHWLCIAAHLPCSSTHTDLGIIPTELNRTQISVDVNKSKEALNAVSFETIWGGGLLVKGIIQAKLLVLFYIPLFVLMHQSGQHRTIHSFKKEIERRHTLGTFTISLLQIKSLIGQ